MNPPGLHPTQIAARKEMLMEDVRIVRAIRLFVASPGDVPAERQAVESVVRGFNGRLRNPLRIDTIRWEEHATPNWMPPQEAIFANTEFAKINLFVGIFRARLGTPTGRPDRRTGEQYPSGTVEEVEAARTLFESRRLRHILLYFAKQDEPLPGDDREQHAAVRGYREKLRAEKVFFGEFTSTDDFARQLTVDLAEVAAAFHPKHRLGQPVDPLVVKLCDRQNQVADFGRFFAEGLREHRGRPQACVITGREDQAHDSFMDRLIDTRVRTLATAARTDLEVSVADYPSPWPDGTAQRELRRRLPRMLVDTFNEGYLEGDCSAAALTAMPAFRRATVVVLHHELRIRRWSGSVARLVRWYLDDYWSRLPDDPERPEVLVFLKVICDERMGRLARWRSRRSLRRICAPDDPPWWLFRRRARRGCRRVLLPELQSVTRAHVEGWLNDHITGDAAHLHEELAQEVMAALSAGPQDLLAMRDLEQALHDLLAKHAADTDLLTSHADD